MEMDGVPIMGKSMGKPLEFIYRTILMELEDQWYLQRVQSPEGWAIYDSIPQAEHGLLKVKARQIAGL